MIEREGGGKGSKKIQNGSVREKEMKRKRETKME